MYKEIKRDLKESGNYIKREPTAQERIGKYIKGVKERIPEFKKGKKITYKSGSPLGKILKTKKTVAYVSGGDKRINLMRGTW